MHCILKCQNLSPINYSDQYTEHNYWVLALGLNQPKKNPQKTTLKPKHTNVEIYANVLFIKWGKRTNWILFTVDLSYM